MGGDYTRFTFDPVKGFSGVRKQQGRVSLDSDFNEFEEILDRRRRAQMYDTVGQAVVPITTPNGFKIGFGNAGQLTIGLGRAYIDGILAECFGDTTDATLTVRDDALGGVRGPAALDYRKQPFIYRMQPNYPALPATGTLHLVYLDVWQREVTVWEDDALREPALNGPDTATRVQTAWQVKVMKEPATSSNCAASPPGWNALTAASTARLTAQATGVLTPPPGPCVINPAGGYTGLENRLYRVEVQDAGTLGGATKATFKWSRDNASLAARVVSIAKVSASESIVTVSSTGRDAWTRFDHDDHIELLDDDVELAMRETGTGGRMARVLSVNHATGEIRVDQDLSTFAVNKARHPRIRGWDVASSTEPMTRDAGNGVTTALEDGISITFGGASTDTLHAGDYWVFAARTADGSIETLVNAPPRGILHHFAKLALVTSGNPPALTSDCRIFWPPPTGGHGESCCTVVVKPGEDIQQAIDSLAGKGGCVCLKMGVHTITNPLVINQDNLTLHGEAPWVTVQRADGGPQMLDIMPAAARNVSVLGIRFEAKNGSKGGPMIALTGVTGGRIAHCVLSFAGEESNPSWQTTGIRVENCRDYELDSNVVQGFATGISGQESDRIRVVGNALFGTAVGRGNGRASAVGSSIARASAGTIGIHFVAVEGIAVERNLLIDYQRGIQVGEIVAGGGLQPVDISRVITGCRIAGNVVTRQSGGIVEEATTSLAFAIAAHVPRCEIVENAVRLDRLADGGILANCGDVLIARNLVSSTAIFDANRALRQVPKGVVATVSEAESLDCTVRDNLFTGMQQAVFIAGTGATRGVVHRADVLSNCVAGSAELFGALKASAGESPQLLTLLANIGNFAAISVSQVRHGRIADNEIAEVFCGIFGVAASGVSVTANCITRSFVGVALGLAVESEVSDNLIEDSLAAGVALLAVSSSVVLRNTIKNSPSSLGLVGLLGTGIRLEGNTVYGGVAGIDLLAVADVDARGNTVQDATVTGILLLATGHELTMSHNRALRCGYRRNAGVNPSPAVGIMAFANAAVLVDSCQAIDIGESSQSGDPDFAGKRYGMWVIAPRARVHGCVIRSRSIAKKDGGAGPHADSRALLVMTMPIAGETSTFADAADNFAEQTARKLVEIVALQGEVMFSANRCTHLDPDGHTTPVVSLSGTHLVVAGNRVRTRGDSASLQLAASQRLSAVANIATGGALITGAAAVPAPYTSFNINA